jgi:hypothetical protein
MKIKLDYQIVTSLHPLEVASVEAQIKSSKSKFRNSHPSTWEWSYSYCVTGRAYSLSQILSGAGRGSVPYSLDETIKNASVCLMAETDKKGIARTADLPSEVIREYIAKDFK